MPWDILSKINFSMKNFIRQNSCYFFACLLLIVFGGIVLLLSSKGPVLLWVNRHYSIFWDAFFKTASAIGNISFSLVVLLALAVWKNMKTSWRAFICILSTALVVQILKHLVFPGTPRPILYFDGVEDLRLLKGVVQLQTESFPSGHTAAAFAISTILAFILPRKKYHWILALIAACVGYARIYLSQHFITDVYVGMIIGISVTTLVYYGTGKLKYFKS